MCKTYLFPERIEKFPLWRGTKGEENHKLVKRKIPSAAAEGESVALYCGIKRFVSPAAFIAVIDRDAGTGVVFNEGRV